MVVHENIRINAASHAVLVHGKNKKVFLEIGRVLENALFLIASDNNVVESAGKLDAWFACHEARLSKQVERVKMS